MTASSAARLGSARPRTRCWRVVLAALISLSLVLSFFHCCCLDGDEGGQVLSAARTSCDISTNDIPAKTSPTPHCCHCLAHVTTVAVQDSAVAIEYTERPFGLAAAPLLDAADPASPFKPPRV